MAKAIFTTTISPVYDDLPEVRYHFPTTYLNQVKQSVGDWIIYYEPRRPTGDRSSSGGRLSYFATARVERLSEDPYKSDHYYAHISDYLPFDSPVRFNQGGIYLESGLQKDDGSTNRGAFGRSVRLLSEKEYELILAAGFAHVLGNSPRVRSSPDVSEDPVRELVGFSDASQLPYLFNEQPRRMIEQLISKPFRQRAFASAVKDAYADTCAITGLKIINGGGQSEVDAAHIQPVSDHGPDSPRNGIALSKTVHWMFDRGLISITDDYKLLRSERYLPPSAAPLLPKNGTIIMPDRVDLRPHPTFLAFHRNNKFKG